MAYPLFYDSVNGDRAYNSDSFSDWLKKFFTTGVFAGDLFVSATYGMVVQVGAGYVNIEGKVRIYDTPETLTVPTAHASMYRRDAVVIERNDTDRDFYLKIVTGTPASSSSAAIAPAPVRTGGIYQIVLAHIMVYPGATNITDAYIFDRRYDPDLCGIVAGTVQEMDFSQFAQQFQAYYSEFVAGNESDFRTWFATIQDILDADTAGHLLNEINKRVVSATPLIEIDETAAAGTTDGDLYRAIIARGWGEVLE